MNYLILKSIHIIFVVCWFAGLFYIGRIFIYYKEAESRTKNERKVLQSQFIIMAQRVMNIIIWPSVLLVSAFGFSMIYFNLGILNSLWMKIKLILVLFLLIYVLVCQKFLNDMKKGSLKISVEKLRFFSEGATLFLISIISIATLKTQISWLYFTAIFILIAILLSILVKVYKKYILKNSSQNQSHPR
ncbi:MAG: protoporphyrinogen IX oxidase [Cytophagia bacterium]|nr:protoporphyrinogen IX oxidase [Cytophagia bacterium]